MQFLIILAGLAAIVPVASAGELRLFADKNFNGARITFQFGKTDRCLSLAGGMVHLDRKVSSYLLAGCCRFFSAYNCPSNVGAVLFTRRENSASTLLPDVYNDKIRSIKCYDCQ